MVDSDEDSPPLLADASPASTTPPAPPEGRMDISVPRFPWPQRDAAPETPLRVGYEHANKFAALADSSGSEDDHPGADTGGTSPPPSPPPTRAPAHDDSLARADVIRAIATELRRRLPFAPPPDVRSCARVDMAQLSATARGLGLYFNGREWALTEKTALEFP